MYFRIDALIKVSETVSCGEKYNLLSADLPSHLFKMCLLFFLRPKNDRIKIGLLRTWMSW